MTRQEYKYIDSINSPDDLKKLDRRELVEYCRELRRYIVEQLSDNPGHLGSSLGVVELTVALHYVYDTPHDKLVWDVGHQAYAHKIITGRREQFGTNRKLGGISGFPRMEESPYDAFGGGHSSVSISAAYGIASAAKIKGEKRQAVAIIGDGALTGGLAFEGLNNAGASNTDMLVILNDNDMSIDPNVGAMKEYLLSITASRQYNKLKDKTWKFLSPVPGLRRAVQKSSAALKTWLLRRSNLFESFNFRYFGPVDGHDLTTLVRTLRQLKQIPGPKLLHVLTLKGKGYSPAEKDQSNWHAPGRFDPETGVRLSSSEGLPPRYQDIFGSTLLDLALADRRIVGVTPAMPKGCSMNIMMEKLPGRCFDVGIAEGHAVTFSAGLAAGGLVPFCNIYSSFMQRAYDNVIHDVALQKLPVVLCLDRAGIVGEDGATHQGVFDIAYFMPVPNLVISSPLDEAELRNMMYTASRSGVPFVIRYPRGRGEGVTPEEHYLEIPVGKARILREGKEVALLTLGPLGNAAARAAERAAAVGISVLHADLRFAKPLDYDLLHRVGRDFRRVVTLEDGVRIGGVGAEITRFLSENGYPARVTALAVGDGFVEHGTPQELYKLCGIDEKAVYRAIVGEGR
ncbi:MAG: 1-deoxy-D-xylulose-5-phosphate synthase [Rikenellaceae bacterium]|nr:1-deoxy-D-xylulose-5-phosphate synthase [Rikenellaceae bacterium]